MVAVVLGGCGPKVYNYPYAKEPDPRTSEYVIGVSDELSISVWKNNELSTGVVVRPDGTVTLPLVGDVTAKGLTPTQLKDAIKKKLEAFVKDATVTVSVIQVNSYSVTVSGKVARPGVIESKRFLTVGDAIASAGGPTRFADSESVVVVRRGPDGKTRRIPINYEELAAGRRLEQNIVLVRDDQVYVP